MISFILVSVNKAYNALPLSRQLHLPKGRQLEAPSPEGEAGQTMDD